MGTKPKLEVNIHETTILFYTVGIESYKRVEKNPVSKNISYWMEIQLDLWK